MELLSIAFLCMLLIVQQLFYMRQVQKLVDKCMSRNFHEYQVAQGLGKPKPAKIVAAEEVGQMTNEIMGVMQDFHNGVI